MDRIVAVRGRRRFGSGVARAVAHPQQRHVHNNSTPTLLAIDTATEFCSIALMRAGRVVERTEFVGQSHSSVVLPWIEAMLGEQALRLADCDAIAFGAGPGSFTGLRIACGVTQGLAWGAERPVVPIGNLAAMAFVAAGHAGSPRRVACAIDARMREAYWAVFDVAGDDVREISPPALSAAADLAENVRAFAPAVVAGNALSAFTESWPAGQEQLLPDLRASAGAIAVLAARAWHEGRTVAPAEARPVYVRDRVALTVQDRLQARQDAAAAA